MERSGKRGARWAGRIGLVAASTFFGLLAAEVGVRLLDRAPAVKPIWLSSDTFVYRRSDNPVLSFEIKPNYRNDAPDLFQTYESTNAHGQRDLERTLEKPPGVRRVILLGDSVVEGTGVPEARTISRQLEDSFPPGSVEVLNFGVSGYCTLAETELLEQKGLAFDPDVVVLLFVENDFQNFNAEAFQLGEVAARPAWVKQAFLRSEAFRLAALRFDLWGFGSEQDPMGRNSRAIGDNNVVQGLARLRDLAEREGFAPLVAIWPRFDGEAIVDRPPMPGGEGLVVERLAAALGLPSRRLSPYFARDLAGRPAGASPRALYTIGDRMHPSDEGCRVAARALREVLADLPSLQPRHGDDAAAIEAARALGEADEPNYARVYTRLGNLAHESGDLEGAAGYYRRSLEQDPESVEAYLNLGIVLHTQRRLDEAALQFREALRLDPGEARAWVGLGRVFEDDGQPERARERYESALRVRPGYAEAWGRLGTLYYRAGDGSRAREAFHAAIAADPRDVLTRNNLGRLLEAEHDLAGAAREYEAALAIDPGRVEIRNNLGIVRAAQGRPDEAIVAFRDALAHEPGYVKAHANLGAALWQLGRHDEAIEAYRDALRFDPEYLPARFRLGELLAETGDRDGAGEQFRRALSQARDEGREDLVRQIELRLGTLDG